MLSWTEQNEIRGVLGVMTAGVARKTLDTANSNKKSLNEGCDHCSKDEKDTASVTRRHKFFNG